MGFVRILMQKLSPDNMFLLLTLVSLTCIFADKVKVDVIENNAFKQAFELADYYDKYTYPGTIENPAVTVTHELSLIRIVEFDQKTLVIDAWPGLEWKDPRLVWTGSPEMIRVPQSSIWTPDIVFYNNQIDTLEYKPNVMVQREGVVFMVPFKRFKTYNCKTTSDELIVCSFKFGSWTYSNREINLVNRTEKIDLSNYMENEHLDVVNTTVVRNVQYYSCCPEGYIDLTYNIVLRKRVKDGWFGFP